MSFSQGAGTAAPSPTPSTLSQITSQSQTKKRSRPDENIVYSQPKSTSTGREIMTRVVYACEYLREKNHPLLFSDVFSHLSIQVYVEGNPLPQMAPQGGRDWNTIQSILQKHKQVDYDPNGFNGKSSYRYRPKHNVRSADELKGFLQRQTNSVGIRVLELKDGWPGALDTINELESEGEILVTHHQKTNQPLLVWENDSSLAGPMTLIHSMDDEFKSMWLNIQLPQNPDDLRSRLVAANLNPTTAPKEVKKTKPKARKKTQRKGKINSNKHMLDMFRDYADKKA
ncbi:uncharacterized protein K452DRAFT_312304 [Aplosporella prunicola CBS 121167]|uniref:Transcription initiation factor IIE subunit beta n=1 Tax=Aplosporella prunicola CBS 121167 TaxID=1176127 RepID=A0A6A6B2N3_9PEZI|nr:uncharacterized protein K452DRAFT_312304 [Aplosporella prunicola CBS 121167]KAF2137484.1 hypothetical protein K452DRAFT_312304 [Aplosporella prunicola CBS 121167]